MEWDGGIGENRVKAMYNGQCTMYDVGGSRIKKALS
jgi:hypothetical protein